MRYNVKFYANGVCSYGGYVDADSPKDAASSAKLLNKYQFYKATHITVRGTGENDRLERFLPGLTPISVKPTFHKATYNKMACILVLLGQIGEMHRYNSLNERDEIYEKITCLTQPKSAESASQEEEQSVTIVSTEGMSDSKSGLTETKILSGSATNVTCLERQTPLNTEKIFGAGKSPDMDSPTWSATYQAYPSRQSQSFSAKVKYLGHKQRFEYPGINRDMLSTAGQTIIVEKKRDGLWEGNGWLWKEEWLDNIQPLSTKKKAIVIECGEEFTSKMPRTGSFIEVEPTGRLYFDGKFIYYDTSLLIAGDYVKVLPPNRHSQGYFGGMNHCVGKTFKVQEVYQHGIYLEGASYIWSYKSLKKVKNDPLESNRTKDS